MLKTAPDVEIWARFDVEIEEKQKGKFFMDTVHRALWSRYSVRPLYCHLEHAGFALKFVRDIGNLREIPMRDFAERICTFGDFYQKIEAFFWFVKMCW